MKTLTILFKVKMYGALAVRLPRSPIKWHEILLVASMPQVFAQTPEISAV